MAKRFAAPAVEKTDLYGVLSVLPWADFKGRARVDPVGPPWEGVLHLSLYYHGEEKPYAEMDFRTKDVTPRKPTTGSPSGY